MRSFPFYGVPYQVGCREETSQGVDSKNGPDAIRKGLARYTRGVSLPIDMEDRGDIIAKEETVPAVLEAVEKQTISCLNNKSPFAFIGGSHTITLGTLRGLRKAIGQFSLIYFDAHLDLMPRSEIDYGSTIYHAIKEGTVNPKQLFYIGARQCETAEREIVSQHNIKLISNVDVERIGVQAVTDELLAKVLHPVFISVDLDVMDPSLVPGVSTPCPFGLSPLSTLSLLKTTIRSLVASQDRSVMGFDIVECAPRYDCQNVTANLAGALLYATSACIALKS